MPFDAFISYSHAADGRLAPAVQRGLHRLARPWHRRRALWIFRDQTGLAVTPGLWSSIQTALDGSQYFVLLASPEAARSPWVNKEIEHWVATKSPQRILPVLTDGEWCWDATAGDFTGTSTAVPAALRGVFVEEPLYLDLRWARDDLHLSLRHARFRDAIAQLAAPMHGVSKDELESEDVRQLRRARRLWSTAMAMVVVLTLLASLTGVLAMRNAGRANASAREAQRQQEHAQTQEGQAQAATAETRRQERLAAEQRALADQAAADAATQQGNAERQQENARRNAEDARRQKENARRYAEDARRQKEDARRAQEDARRQQQNALTYARDARRQQQLADQAEARARQQEQIALRHQELARLATEERKRQEKIAREQEQLAREATEEARRQREEAALQQRIAINRRLVDRARTMIEDDPRKALMLAVAAQQVHPDAQTRDLLSYLVMSTHYAGALAGVTDVATVSDGALAAASGAAVSLWDVSRPAQPRRLADLRTDGSADKTLASSPDGQLLAVLDGLSTVVLWDVSDPARPARLAELADAAGIVTVTFSPDGRTVATSNRDKNTVLWDLANRQNPVTLATLPAAQTLTFSPDGRTAVTSGATATVWNLTDRTRPVQLATLRNARRDGAVVFSPKLPVVVVEEDDGWVVPWDLRDPAQPKRGSATEAATGDSTITRLAFSSDGLVLAVGDTSGTTGLRSLTLGSLPGQTGLTTQIASLTGRDGPVRSVALSRDGQMLVTSGERRSATLWKSKGAFAREAVAALTRPSPADVVGLAFRPDGRALTAADAPGTAVSWDLDDPAHPVEGAPRPLQSGRIQLMDVSQDGRTMAVGGMDEAVTLLDLTRPAEPTLLATIREGGDVVRAVTFSPDGRTLAVGHADGKTRLFDLTDRSRPVRVAELADRGYLAWLAFSADGRTLAVAAGYNVSLWSLADRSAPVRNAELSLGATAMAVAFSPDGRTLAVSAGWGGAATLWDIADLARPHRLATLQGADTAVSWLGFSPDGRILATAGISEARLWEITERDTPVRFATLANTQLRTRDLAFSPDGHTLAAGGSRSVTLWDYSVPKDLGADPGKHACEITGRGLTAEEWARYIPELQHRPTC